MRRGLTRHRQRGVLGGHPGRQSLAESNSYGSQLSSVSTVVTDQSGMPVHARQFQPSKLVLDSGGMSNTRDGNVNHKVVGVGLGREIRDVEGGGIC